MIKFYNSLSNQLEPFVPIEEGKVTMYVCGPTVYNYPHIGNARPMVVFDTLKKMLEASGYDVTYISNYTDVDDKIIKRAKEEGVSERVISERYIEAYNEDRNSLLVDIPDRCVKVTETMEQIISFIVQLVNTGFAYAVDGDVYFRVQKIKEYGILSKQKIEDLFVGARIDENSKKENALDFTLWKETTDGISWESPFSKGRPGWHTECVVMIQKEVEGGVIDIHGGGMDLKFPHHENEIAQALACNNKMIANYWLHNGMINVDGAKMSKSLGNVVWVKDYVKELGSNVVRWILLSTHYRSPLNISDELVKSTRKEIEKLVSSLKQSYVKMEMSNKEIGSTHNQELFDMFLNAMQDDLNTPNAFRTLFDANKLLNAAVRVKEIDFDLLASYIVTIEEMLHILGIHIPRVILCDGDRELYNNWRTAVQQKDFEAADQYRSTLVNRGIL